MKRTIGFLAALLILAGCNPEEKYYVKQLAFPEGASLEEKVEMASRLVPSPEQYNWQQLELTAFLHFGINTFTGQEWGSGKEDPALFHPEDLDCRQWVRILKQAGFKMVILTAKHHDGFCLWPTATTAHSVASSPWKAGKGDVVGELRRACEEYGMKFGLYLSPWDRNASCYGNSPAYNRMYAAQLKELLTGYGKVDEIWFDGANGEGPNGRVQHYDWPLFEHIIDSLQPQAVTAISGSDVRWVGNERGLGRETEWSVTPFQAKVYPDADRENRKLGLKETSADLGSRELLARAGSLYWYPSEVDVSIRPGWFYHDAEDSRVRTLANLKEIYFRSVGYNSVLLLNIPPDRRGRIHEADSARLAAFGSWLSATFRENLLEGTGTPAVLAEGESAVFEVRSGKEANILRLGENILKGQRVEAFRVEVLTGGNWKEICRGTTVGYCRLVRFETCRPEKVRIRIEASRGEVELVAPGLFMDHGV